MLWYVPEKDVINTTALRMKVAMKLGMLKAINELTLENTYLDFPDHFYHRVDPSGLKNAHLISFNPDVATILDLDPCSVQPSDLARFFGGGDVLQGSEPLAMKYGGHQFGQYNPDLGDGRGLLLGEVLNSKGERWDLHLKGAGKTAYSRFGDGRAVLRSSIREYLISAAMQGLGIPTTQALCLVGSEEYTMREGMEPCAKVLRVTQCHIRFGHFEHFYYTKQHDNLKTLADYCLDRYFPECKKQAPDDSATAYLAMFKEIRDRSILMVAKWQAYGFVHGVMNTDNMSILGETFDYGPYVFMDQYQPDFISNHTDHEGRYAFKRQPDIMLWNLSCLAQALLPLIERDELAAVLDEYKDLYVKAYTQQMRLRLGWLSEQEDDEVLIDQLIRLATVQRIDLNRFLRDLCDLQSNNDTTLHQCLSHFSDPIAATNWLLAYTQRTEQEGTDFTSRQQQMRSVNPCYLLRSYMLEEAIREANNGDYRLVNTLQSVVRYPFDAKDEYARYAGQPPEWAGGISLSCSS
ncbi:MAG: protein adenylyltransferase SelO [Pseudomonadales bacterium]|jgi:uncharacterized protein YdiU (UPF0061 family)